MSGQDDARATGYFALDLDGVYRTTADDTGSAGPSVGLGHPVDRGETALGQPGTHLPPQLIVR
jgi:hypothetical protein